MQKIVTELSIEETFDLIQEILDNPDVLLMKCNRGNGVMGHMLEKMRSVVVAALNNEEFNDAPGEYEVENFVQELMLLPYLIVQDDTDKIWTYAAAIVILASNYLQLYPNEKLQRGIFYDLYSVRRWTSFSDAYYRCRYAVKSVRTMEQFSN